MNVLDLGFFASIQSLTLSRAPNSLKDLIEAVEEEYDNYDDVMLLAKVFITLQSCMIERMNDEGGLGYKLQHMNKDAMLRENRLPKL